MHARLCGDSVDDIQRVVVVECADTTDAHRRCSRRISVGRDVHAGHTSLEGFDRVVFILLGDFVDINGGDSAGHVGLALHRVADDDNLVKHLGVLFEDDFHGWCGQQCLRFVAYIADCDF